MCGIAGIFSNKENINSQNIYDMISSLNHRGPDNSGVWINNNNSVFLGHTRLSILDLSSNGNQPFHSSNGRYHLTFNGEIYNYKELREYLQKDYSINFNSTSDTEVLTELISLKGIHKATELLNGMFAFAVWDSHENIIHLVRDRFGEKPLFYYFKNNNLFFASEIGAILKIKSIPKIINKKALSQYLRFNYIDHPLTIYKDICKLSPGHILSINKDMVAKAVSYHIVVKEDYQIKSKKDTEKIIEHQIIKSCLSRKVSDVPIGCFLSGGIDSSLVTSIIQKSSIQKIKTFTIGFDDQQIDESKYAENIASYLGTEHHTLRISDKELINNIPNLSEIYGEPFADQSSLATHILCNYSSKSLKVVLSGDGGDEMFLGYDRYYQVNTLRRFLKGIELIGLSNKKKFIFKQLIKIINKGNMPFEKDKIMKLLALLIDSDYKNIYQKFNSIFRDRQFPQMPLNENIIYQYQDLENINLMNEYDINKYLPDCILTKVDRASMYNSLEVRSPFLDHSLYDLINKLNKYNVKKLFHKKYILKKLLSNYLPKSLFNRPKRGFSAPLKNWIDGPLKEWTLDNLSEESLKEHSLFDHKIIEKLKVEHYSGVRSWHNQIWNLVIFQQWYKSKFVVK